MSVEMEPNPLASPFCEHSFFRFQCENDGTGKCSQSSVVLLNISIIIATAKYIYD